MSTKNLNQPSGSLTPKVVQPDPVKKKQEREEYKAEGYFSIYANDLQVQTSIWDMRIKLGEVDADQSRGKLRVKSFGEVRISPQLAKKLTMILILQLKGYEEKHGQIPTQKD
ncbi:MAG: DUF3467 domain-containing protein [Acidobacteriota bacterium]